MIIFKAYKYLALFQDIKLITSKNKHRFLAPAGVQKLSRDEFEQFASSTL